MAPQVRLFVPLLWKNDVGQKDVGQKDVGRTREGGAENEFRAWDERQVKWENSEAQDTRASHSHVHRPKRKPTRGLSEEPVFSASRDARAEQSPRPAKGVTKTRIKIGGLSSDRLRVVGPVSPTCHGVAPFHEP